jgi:hypothetical protein
VETPVLVVINALRSVGRLIVLPDLLERRLQVRRRVPARLALDRTVAEVVGKDTLRLGEALEVLPDRGVEIGLGGSRGDKAGEDSGESRDTHVNKVDSSL